MLGRLACPPRHPFVILGLVPRIHPSAIAGARREMDGRAKPDNDNVGGSVRMRVEHGAYAIYVTLTDRPIKESEELPTPSRGLGWPRAHRGRRDPRCIEKNGHQLRPAQRRRGLMAGELDEGHEPNKGIGMATGLDICYFGS